MPFTDATKFHYRLRKRIYKIQKLIDGCPADKDLRFALRMWQDAHIPLANYYQRRKLEDCSDTKIPDLDTRTPDRAPLRPNVDLMFHEGELPNLLDYIPYCNYWRQTKKKKNSTLVESLIWLNSKAIPWRCNVREIRNTFAKDCLPEHPQIYQVKPVRGFRQFNIN